MTNRLDGSVALVTGASSGIGEATARTLAAQGAKVVAVARRVDRLQQLVTDITSAGGTAIAVEADVASQEQAIAAVEAAVEAFGSLDIVINNAGVMLLGPFADAPTAEWDQMIDVNVKGLLYVAHAALPHLLASAATDGGRGVSDLVNISSVAGRHANAGSGVYNLTKFGVGAVSESMRQEFTAQNVRVSLIEPGAVDTELMDHIRPEIQEMARGRFTGVEKLTSQDIAESIEFVVTRPRRVAINEVLIRPTDQVR